LRAAEKSAKEKKLCLWEHQSSLKTGANDQSATSGPNTRGTSFEATVIRVWTADQISITSSGNEELGDRRLQLSSVRGPR
jgi:staphylococcal nuclease domain-containing protein 1